MKKKTKIWIASVVGVGLILVIVLAIAPLFFGKTLNEGFSAGDSSLKFSGKFEKIDYNVEGSFKVYNQNGKKILRIENLDIANGPDVYLVLSNKKPSFGNSEYEIVEKLKANKGSFNVELNENIDFSQYKYLLIHCKAFSHTFAGAEIATISL